jgi:hypothetical protein
MKIRQANKFDQEQVFRMLRSYRNASPIRLLDHSDNEEHISKLFNSLLHGRGVVLLAEKDTEVVGMLMAVIDQNIWDPEVLIMRELAYWVDEDHRGSTAGYRLLAEYKKVGEELVLDGRIKAIALSKMVSSPDLKYNKFGFDKLEETWVAGV